jgi:hypothetical protein
MDSDEMLRVQDTVLVLSRSVYDLGRVILASVPNGLAERVLDSRVITVHKMSIDKLHGERRFAWSARDRTLA